MKRSKPLPSRPHDPEPVQTLPPVKLPMPEEPDPGAAAKNYTDAVQALVRAGRHMAGRRDVEAWWIKDMHMEDSRASFVMLVHRRDGTRDYETIRVSSDGTVRKIRA